MSAQSDAFHIYYWNREDETLDCVALEMSMGIEEIVDEKTNAKDHSRLLHAHVHCHWRSRYACLAHCLTVKYTKDTEPLVLRFLFSLPVAVYEC